MSTASGLPDARAGAGPREVRRGWRWLVRALTWTHTALTGRLGRTGAVLAAVALTAVQTPLTARGDGLRVGLALALALAHTGALVLTTWRPRTGAALSVVAAAAVMLATRGAGGRAWPWQVTSMITEVLVVVAVCLLAGWVAAFATALAAVAVSGALALSAPHPAALDARVSDVLLFTSITAVALALTAALAERAALGAALAREQRFSAEEHAQRRLVEERARIARELHDVIAHTMSLIGVQARSARYRLPDVSPGAAVEFEDIADRAKDALHQMRGVLAVLRTDEQDASRAPQPDLRQVPALVERARCAGLDVTLAWDVPDDLVPAPVTGLSAHRIITEALSNTMRHAPDLPAEVRVRAVDGVLVLSVENMLLAAGAPGSGGHGLRGMAERAAAAGGTLHCGPTPDGTFRVAARLPLSWSAAP